MNIDFQKATVRVKFEANGVNHQYDVPKEISLAEGLNKILETNSGKAVTFKSVEIVQFRKMSISTLHL